MTFKFVTSALACSVLWSGIALGADNSKPATATPAANGTAAAAKAAASPAATVANPFTPENCPVVGNKNSKIYHVKGGASFEKMLKNKPSGADNRECFKTEDDAKKAGFRKSKT